MERASEPTIQFSIFGTVSRPVAVEKAVNDLKSAPGVERGAIHTKPEVAAFILNLSGYTTDRPLYDLRFLEPSFGDGVFLLEAVRRLLVAWQRDQTTPPERDRLLAAVRAVEVHEQTFRATRSRLRTLLHEAGVADSERLLDDWLICDDFLLAPLEGQFDAVAGNPPYVRQENIPNALVQHYRRDYASVYDRADLYVPFIERGLDLLAPSARLSYICADRWMKNNYGGPLRRIVADRYGLLHVVGMHGADAFEGEVDAYPSVFTVERPSNGDAPTRETAVAEDPALDAETLTSLAHDLEHLASSPLVRVIRDIAIGDAPWVLHSDDALDVLRALEARLPTLKEAGCVVSIGVATGADRVFIAPVADLPIEEDRILPLVMARDVREEGTIEWSGKALANPYGPDGRLVDLAAFPRLAAYFMANGERLRKRHVAKKTPSRWYRTIDKVRPGLAETPKLLIPDIKGRATVAYDPGGLYPHHNLYHVTSSTWDLRALQAVLRSRLAEFQVASYAVRMRGGYLRFQAQYLRRIRLPYWDDVPPTLRKQLVEAAVHPRDACDEAVRALYGLSDAEWNAVTASVGDA